MKEGIIKRRKLKGRSRQKGGKVKEHSQVLWARGGRGLARACKVVKLERPGDGEVRMISNVDRSTIKDCDVGETREGRGCIK